MSGIFLGVAVGVAFGTFAHSIFRQGARHWELCCLYRQQFITWDGLHQIQLALSEADYEQAIAAHNELMQQMQTELERQLAHPFDPLRFWRTPPLPGEHW
jgi:hypothetical protein